MIVTLTIGWTKSAMPEYSSYSDGYRPGAEQHTETIEVEVDAGGIRPEDFAAQMAEQVFYATNAPGIPTDGSTLASRIAKAIMDTGYRGKGFHYSLSIGDTVTVGEVTMTIDPHTDMWTRVHLANSVLGEVQV